MRTEEDFRSGVERVSTALLSDHRVLRTAAVTMTSSGHSQVASSLRSRTAARLACASAGQCCRSGRSVSGLVMSARTPCRLSRRVSGPARDWRRRHLRSSFRAFALLSRCHASRAARNRSSASLARFASPPSSSATLSGGGLTSIPIILGTQAPVENVAAAHRPSVPPTDVAVDGARSSDLSHGLSASLTAVDRARQPSAGILIAVLAFAVWGGAQQLSDALPSDALGTLSSPMRVKCSLMIRRQGRQCARPGHSNSRARSS